MHWSGVSGISPSGAAVSAKTACLRLLINAAGESIEWRKPNDAEVKLSPHHGAEQREDMVVTRFSTELLTEELSKVSLIAPRTASSRQFIQ